MEWSRLLSQSRLRRPDAVADEGRSPFQQDIDRITFSAAFRRLAHKTQVHPLSPNDHVHTRLTHSIEVASVGRSLGTVAGAKIAPQLQDTSITPDVFGYVVQAACLAHDIGNPPFGHSGEDAICDWFKNTEKSFELAKSEFRLDDFKKFDGNAQGFRILTQLENYKWSGGLQLTYAVLGTFTKYPRASIAPMCEDSYPGFKKVGFFGAEQDYFSEIAEGLGLIQRQKDMPYWCRHPLAFLVEAADDICYAIIDIEDGHELGYLSFEEAREVLAPIAGDQAGVSPSMAKSEQIAKLRAVAIGRLVMASAKVFIDNEHSLLDGTFTSDIVKLTPFKENMDEAINLAKRKLYTSERNAKLEIAGAQMIKGLLEIFGNVIIDLEEKGFDRSKISRNSQRLARIMGGSLARTENAYQSLLCLTDFVSGMTDRFAVDTYRTLKGISL